MKHSKRLLCSIIILCNIAYCFLPVPALALTDDISCPRQITETLTTDVRKFSMESAQLAQAISPQLIAFDKDQTTTAEAIAIEPDKTTAPAITVEPDTTTEPAITTTNSGIKVEDKGNTKAGDEEHLWYRKQNPMKKEHQKLLWDYCKQRNIGYIDMLALIYTESNFKEKCTTGKHYGYFQISSGNCKNLSKTLKTQNKPLDGAININWGTAMYSWILEDKRVKSLTGKKQRDVALSIYQRGSGGYDKKGISTSFLKVYYKKWDKVNEWFEK